ncbi:MAG: 50S ribosomal protein L29 [Candidatus Shapirobacteria bacterium]|nr:50S ribosomal protein L29 [Candidatus Shapirobacteria bacterium]MDD5073925.1 50S ribosomal protein L29 [Candidatus Shapirobacteria bacterium]MDD5481559.1 50S ribosomal protein L29 [Candidatus Shapirobacteria bacterium]
MKKDQKEKINQMSLSELEKELAKESQALAKLVIDKGLAKIKNVHQLGQAKKRLAVIKTKITEKKLAKKQKNSND